MLAPGLSLWALAGVDTPGVMPCCKRRRLAEAASRTAQPAVPCHHGAVEQGSNGSGQEADASADTTEVSVRSLACCCGRHCDCDRTSKTSNWARLAAGKLCFVSLLTALIPAGFEPQFSIFPVGSDSARAPPRAYPSAG